jgi:hypothetical protein
MDPITIGVISGAAVGVGVLIARLRGQKAAGDVLPLLQQRGPLTIPELMTAMGLSGMTAQSKIVFALDSLVRSGKVLEGDVPPGTAQMQKIKVRKYRAVTA